MIFRDSTTATDIPLADLAAVLGYGDGNYTWSSADWDRFPDPIVKLSVVVFADDAGDILDVENGDATPAQAPGWADRFKRSGRRLPTIYCNRATIAAVRQAMGGRAFDWLAATLDGTTTGCDGAAAIQTRGQAQTLGHYDEGIIVDPGWIGQGGEGMFSAEDIAQAFVIGAYAGALGRLPENQAAVDGAVAHALTSGVGAAVSAILQSPEAANHMLTVAAMIADYKAGKLGGAVPAAIPPHTHIVTTSGTTGNPQ